MDTWHLIFGTTPSDISGWQMSARALLILAYGLILFRVAGRRVFTRGSPLDLIITLVIGSNLSRALTGPARLLPTLAATTTMLLAYWLIIRAAYRFPRFNWLVKGGAVTLVKDGELNRAAMHRHGFTEADIEEAIHKQGVSSVQEVSRAYMEADGSISILRKSRG